MIYRLPSHDALFWSLIGFALVMCVASGVLLVQSWRLAQDAKRNLREIKSLHEATKRLANEAMALSYPSHPRTLN